MPERDKDTKYGSLYASIALDGTRFHVQLWEHFAPDWEHTEEKSTKSLILVGRDGLEPPTFSV